MIPYCAGDWPSYDSISADKALLQVQNLELINRIAELEAQLASMTAERDSESRLAKQYCEEADELKRQLKGMRRDELKMSLWEE
jgi:hypothetical protein